MKRIIPAILLMLFGTSCLHAAPTITVTATSTTILGTSQTISLTCALIDPNQTGILRSGGTVVTNFSTSTITPGTTATCGPIWANDVITDGFGNASTSYYLISVSTVSNGIVASTPAVLQAYQFAGSGTFDLSSTLPFSLGPVSPAGSVLGQNLTFTGTNNSTGPWTFGTLTVTSLNKTFYADGVTNTTIQAALNAAPAGATVVVPAGCGGTVAAPSATITISQAVRLIIQCNITSSQVPNISIQSSGVTIEGSGGNSPSGGSTDATIWTNSGAGNTIIYGDGVTSFRGLAIEKINFRDSGAHLAARTILFRANAADISVRDVVTVGIGFDGSQGNQELIRFERVRINNYVNRGFNFDCTGNQFCNSITFNSTYADLGTGAPGVGYDLGNGNFILQATDSDFAPTCGYRFVGGGTVTAQGTDHESGTTAGWCVTGTSGNVTLVGDKSVGEVLPISITGAANVTLINPNTSGTTGASVISLGASANGQNILMGDSGLAAELNAGKTIAGINAPSVTLQRFGGGQVAGTSGYFFYGTSVPLVNIIGDSISNGALLSIINTHAAGCTYNVGELFAVGSLDFRNACGGGGFTFNSNAGAGRGIFSFTNTADRIYTFPNSAASIAAFNVAQTWSATQTNMPLTTPTLTGLTNGTGIQLFNSSTTCTTAASVGAICTTAAITLPVAYADTNYRLSCTGLTPTNVPIVQTYAKSNTTFTITIAALTAAAATFTSYDCTAHHN